LFFDDPGRIDSGGRPADRMNLLDARGVHGYIRQTEEKGAAGDLAHGVGRTHLPASASSPIRMIISVIAGSCAIKNH